MKLNVSTSSSLQEGYTVRVKRNAPEAIQNYANKIGTVTKVLKQYNVAEVDFDGTKKRIALRWLLQVKA